MTPNPDPDNFTRLVLLRHGETEGNQQNLWTGWTDTPLSSRGRQQIKRTADFLAQNGQDFHIIYSSPIGRAWRTAKAVGKAVNLTPMRDDALKEMHFGELESLNSQRFAIDYPDIYASWQNRTDESFGWPGGETRRAFRSRIRVCIQRLAAAHPGQRILLVTHSGVIRMALAHFVPDRFAQWWEVKLGNCSFTHLVDPTGTAKVPVLNDVGHLIPIN
jgi:broad specificity phosphatase PhoE